MKPKIHCPFCDLDFDYNGTCPNCNRDREGLTEEDRLKPLNKRFVANSYLLDMQKDIRKKNRKRKRIKWDNNPFPGKIGKARIIK